MNAMGVARQKPTVETRPLYSAVLSSVPRAGERATVASPSSEWLEMFLLDVEPVCR
jgi:hypothetical protein